MQTKSLIKLSAMSIISLTILSHNSYAVAKSETITSTNKETTVTSSKSIDPGQAFLTENKKKPGVVTLPDGLQYKILKQGKGPKPTDIDLVTVNYAGKLLDGTEFDSSYSRGEPATFPVAGVIPGWVEALKLMPVGSTWELYIPADLAYGEAGAPPSIGPNQTLIFKVELLGINQS
jgi:FKBP-type peptidyl-prolyl cis-trans isomerase FklB